MIRIGVDVWNLPGDRRGIGRYVRGVLAAWARDWPARVAVTLVVPERPAWFAGRRYTAELDGRRYRVRSRGSLRRRDFDALWFPFNGPSWPDTFGGPAIATLHDASTFVLPGFDAAARATFVAAAVRCDRILTDSDFAARELVRVLGLRPERIWAIPLGVDPPLPPVPPAIDPAGFGRYILYVGSSEPRKNLITVFAAVRLLRASGNDVRLVLIGAHTGVLPPHDARAVAVLGFVDDATLAAFYRGAAATVYASEYEGFGLPILEAMNYGAPVVAARSSSLPEAGGDAALYAPTHDSTAFATALNRILHDPSLAAEMRARGHARAAQMTWSTTAELTLAAFEDLAARAAR
jgi:glycosyltransferase involved in cell wall biosynthesis